MLKKVLIVMVAVVLTAVGCQRIEAHKASLKAEKENTAAAEKVIETSATLSQQIAQLQNDNRQLTNALTAKDAELSETKAQLAAADASAENLNTVMTSVSKSRRNAVAIMGVSIIINLILIILLYRAKKSPKRLALPEGRNEEKKQEPEAKTPKEDNAEDKPAEENETPDKEQDKPEEPKEK